MSWFKKSAGFQHGFFSLSKAKTGWGFYTMKQPNGNFAHVTHVYDFDGIQMQNLPKDAIYVGAVSYSIYADSQYNRDNKVIPVIDGKPILDFYE